MEDEAGSHVFPPEELDGDDYDSYNGDDDDVTTVRARAGAPGDPGAPTEEDVLRYADAIGIDSKVDADLMWIARRGVEEPLPPSWRLGRSSKCGELYYFNTITSESSWDHPCIGFFKDLVAKERRNLRFASFPEQTYGLAPAKGPSRQAWGEGSERTGLEGNRTAPSSTASAAASIGASSAVALADNDDAAPNAQRAMRPRSHLSSAEESRLLCERCNADVAVNNRRSTRNGRALLDRKGSEKTRCVSNLLPHDRGEDTERMSLRRRLRNCVRKLQKNMGNEYAQKSCNLSKDCERRLHRLKGELNLQLTSFASNIIENMKLQLQHEQTLLKAKHDHILEKLVEDFRDRLDVELKTIAKYHGNVAYSRRKQAGDENESVYLDNYVESPTVLDKQLVHETDAVAQQYDANASAAGDSANFSPDRDEPSIAGEVLTTSAGILQC